MTTLEQLNKLSREKFLGIVGPVFEHSPWIASEAWAQRPFATVNHLHHTLCEVIGNADEARQVALIQAHPDLAGHLAREGKLTEESAREQASAGLDRLSPEEMARFKSSNKAYRERFGFPFVICARLNGKEAILADLKKRLNQPPESEIKTALDEIGKIARLRLVDLIAH